MPRPFKELASSLLLTVIAVVSAGALVKTVAIPFRDGTFDLAGWGLFAVTLVGATLALIRSARAAAPESLLARRRAQDGSTPQTSPEAAPPKRRMNPLLDDLSWAAILLALAAINALALFAIVATLKDLFGDSETSLPWLLWQLALLTAACAGLARLGRAVGAELRDRARRRRRNAIHVITGKLLHWPGESSAGGRSRQVAAVAATALLAIVAWANASGPLLGETELREDRASLGERLGGQPSAGATPPTARAGAAPPVQSTARPATSHAARERTDRKRRTSRQAEASSAAAPEPIVLPTPQPAPTSGSAPSPDVPSNTARPGPPKNERRAQKRRGRGQDKSPRTTPDEGPAAEPQPVPTPPPATPVPPCDPAASPVQPPCGQGQGQPPPPDE